MKKGHNFKDFICPDTIELERDHFKWEIDTEGYYS